MSTVLPGGVHLSREARIAASVDAWQKLRQRRLQPVHERHPFITISREYGCEAFSLTAGLVQILNERCRPAVPWVSYDREVLDRVSEELNLSREILTSMDDRRRDAMSEFFDALLNRKVDEALMFRKIAEVMRSLATHGHTVLLGRGGYLTTRDMKNALHIRLVAPRPWRIERIAEWKNLSVKEAEGDVARGEAQRDTFLKTFFLQSPSHPFHLVINNSIFRAPQMAEIIFTSLTARFGEILVED
jgi:cytidylate kinase